jgi:hypothetical protein
MGEVELPGFARFRLGIGVEIAKRVLNVEGLIPTGTLLGLGLTSYPNISSLTPIVLSRLDNADPATRRIPPPRQ